MDKGLKGWKRPVARFNLFLMAKGREQAKNRSSTLGTAAVCALALVLVAVIAVSLSGPPEPVYQGSGLSKWLAGSRIPVSRRVSVRNFQIERALLKRDQVFQSVGPEALPWLLNSLSRQDFQRRANRMAARLCRQYKFVNRLLFNHLDFGWETSEFNCLNLIARLAPGTPYESKAIHKVITIQPAEDHGLATIRLRTLGCFTNYPERVLPLLISELTNSSTVDSAIDGLQHFGSAATPRLYPLALRESGIIRPAEVALEHADPLAYRRLREQKLGAPGP